MEERPLDFLNNLKGKKVVLSLKEGKSIEGTLLLFDIHLNLVIKYVNSENKRKDLFVRGNSVVFVEAKDESEK